MKKNCLLCFLLFFSCYSAFAGESLDSLLNVLDKTIKEADTYVQIKENKLHELKKEARKTPPVSVERYHLNMNPGFHQQKPNNRKRRAKSRVDSSFSLGG